MVGLNSPPVRLQDAVPLAFVLWPNACCHVRRDSLSQREQRPHGGSLCSPSPVARSPSYRLKADCQLGPSPGRRASQPASHLPARRWAYQPVKNSLWPPRSVIHDRGNGVILCWSARLSHVGQSTCMEGSWILHHSHRCPSWWTVETERMLQDFAVVMPSCWPANRTAKL